MRKMGLLVSSILIANFGSALLSSQTLLAQRSSDNLQSESQYETIQYHWEWLWDPASSDIQEWQILSRQLYRITTSPFSDLILADADNARLVRFTPQGELIEIIGREGSGPSEFRDPIEIGFVPGTDTLWVVDRMNLRLNRFKVKQYQTEYIDSHPLFVGGTIQNVAIKDSDSFYLSLPQRGDRISDISITGDIMRSFGEIVEPPYFVSSVSRYNAGYLFIGSDDDILFVGKSMPLYERWSQEGTLLTSLQFPYPESDRKPAPELPRGSMPHFTLGVVYCATNEKLYHWTGQSHIYELSPKTFHVEKRYQFQRFEGIPGRMFGIVLIDGRPQFYLYDSKNGGIMVINELL
ncbi:MAG: hypothetical protein RTU30_14720 [Candidatus Thorarchaeota archaeon]